MDFLDFEYREVQTHFDMNSLHSHDYYELYFLLEGTREIFMQDKMFVLPPNSFCVFPPYHLHMTAGEKYKRINLNISTELLNKDERIFLDNCVRTGALRLDNEAQTLLLPLLREATQIQAGSGALRKEYQYAIAQTVLYLLQKQRKLPIAEASSAPHAQKSDPLVLKLTSYLNKNYRENVTLEKLTEKFYLSKATLCERFKTVMGCSIMQYLSQIRLTKAKSLLAQSDKSMEEIAEACGFSSANYFGLIFKKEVGLSPLHYKKTR